MTINLEVPKSIWEAVRKNLHSDDDPRLWNAALGVLVDEFLQQRTARARNRDCVLTLGACRHWVRPHQSRWNAAGGFAWPEGYRNSTPELDWKVIFARSDGRWESLEKLPGKKLVVLTVAIPARTAKHGQAAIHTRWSTSQEPVLFGFRKIQGAWECVAISDEAENGKLMLQPDTSETAIQHE